MWLSVNNYIKKKVNFWLLQSTVPIMYIKVVFEDKIMAIKKVHTVKPVHNSHLEDRLESGCCGDVAILGR